MARKKTNNKSEDQEEFEVDEPSEVDETNDAENNEGKQTAATNRGRRPTRTRKPPNRQMYKTESSSDIEGLESDGDSGDAGGDDSDEYPPSSGALKKRRGGGAGRGRGRGRGGRQAAAAPPAKKRKVTAKNKKAKEDDQDGNENEDDDDDGDVVEDEEDEEESVEEEEEEEEDSETDVTDTPPEYRSGCFVVLKTDIDNNVEGYPLWKIDGKSLLQKYDKCFSMGKHYYKSTTIYAGWSKAVVDTYYPIKVDSIKIEGEENTVKFDPKQIKPQETK